jgi:hypothetical protein
MSTKRAYAGNARFIEIGSPGIYFRYLVNLDHLEGLRFEELRDVDDDGEPISLGWSVVLLMQGKANGINFPTIEAAISCYNAILNMIQTAGVPLVDAKRLEPPKPEPAIVGADGKAMQAVKDAVEGALEENPTIEAGEAGEDQLDPVVDDEPMLTDEEMEELTKPETDGRE